MTGIHPKSTIHFYPSMHRVTEEDQQTLYGNDPAPQEADIFDAICRVFCCCCYTGEPNDAREEEENPQ